MSATESLRSLWDTAPGGPLALAAARGALARRLREVEAGGAARHAGDAFGCAGLAVRIVRGLAVQRALRRAPLAGEA